MNSEEIIKRAKIVFNDTKQGKKITKYVEKLDEVRETAEPFFFKGSELREDKVEDTNLKFDKNEVQSIL
jgi:Asp-tRNA(Asn)/Glu-tRNA(Gln) amidotransferase C subunit